MFVLCIIFQRTCVFKNPLSTRKHIQFDLWKLEYLKKIGCDMDKIGWQKPIAIGLTMEQSTERPVKIFPLIVQTQGFTCVETIIIYEFVFAFS